MENSNFAPWESWNRTNLIHDASGHETFWLQKKRRAIFAVRQGDFFGAPWNDQVFLEFGFFSKEIRAWNLIQLAFFCCCFVWPVTFFVHCGKFKSQLLNWWSNVVSHSKGSSFQKVFHLEIIETSETRRGGGFESQGSQHLLSLIGTATRPGALWRYHPKIHLHRQRGPDYDDGQGLPNKCWCCWNHGQYHVHPWKLTCPLKRNYVP